jgi:hypothetical protein
LSDESQLLLYTFAPTTSLTMKSFTLQFATLLMAVALSGTEAFSASSVEPPTMTRHRRTPASFSTQLAMSSILLRNLESDESTYHILLAKARECAFSDDGSAVDAKLFLSRILELESGCASGTVSDSEVCDANVVELAEIVSHLRQKVDSQASRNLAVRYESHVRPMVHNGISWQTNELMHAGCVCFSCTEILPWEQLLRLWPSYSI